MGRLLSLTVIMVSVGCVSSPTFETTEQIQLQFVGTGAVLPFSGHDGDQFSSYVTEELILRKVRTVDEGQVRTILSEQRINIADISDDEVNLSKLCESFGADTLVIGSIDPVISSQSGESMRKVSNASISFFSLNEGGVIASAHYSASPGASFSRLMLYPKCAEQLVDKVVRPP